MGWISDSGALKRAPCDKYSQPGTSLYQMHRGGHCSSSNSSQHLCFPEDHFPLLSTPIHPPTSSPASPIPPLYRCYNPHSTWTTYNMHPAHPPLCHENVYYPFAIVRLVARAASFWEEKIYISVFMRLKLVITRDLANIRTYPISHFGSICISYKVKLALKISQKYLFKTGSASKLYNFIYTNIAFAVKTK